MVVLKESIPTFIENKKKDRYRSPAQSRAVHFQPTTSRGPFDHLVCVLDGGVLSFVHFFLVISYGRLIIAKKNKKNYWKLKNICKRDKNEPNRDSSKNRIFGVICTWKMPKKQADNIIYPVNGMGLHASLTSITYFEFFLSTLCLIKFEVVFEFVKQKRSKYSLCFSNGTLIFQYQ